MVNPPFSSIVIDHLSKYHSEDSNNSVGVSHIYFTCKKQGSQGLSNILGSLIKQLCQKLPQFSRLLPQLENLTSGGPTPSDEEIFLALFEMLKPFS
jgi:hypothetical protein